MKMARLNSRARKVLQGRSRGFSLIEVVIAIALLGIIGTAILSALSTASLALIIADQRATSESIARTQMEYVKNSAYDKVNIPPQYSRDPTIPLSYAVNTTAVRLNQDADPNDDDGLQQITVTVTYKVVGGDNSMGTREYVLVDYKRNPVT
jgi:prepilin-type N-terminal cleavage/methylation domain-containing protein